MSETPSPTLIVGAGLAGLHLAWSLHLRGRPFTLLSTDFGKPAWHASAGIVNPVTGKRVVKSWQIDALLPFAQARYAALGDRMGRPSAFHTKPLMRFFRGDPDEVTRFNERRTDPEYTPYLQHPADVENKSFEIAQSGWVDVQQFVNDSRAYFETLGVLKTLDQPFSAKSISFHNTALHWDDSEWAHIVFCEGYHGQNNPFFNWLDYRISRGDVLDFQSHFKLPDFILNREKWVLPLSENRGRTGSTYAWDDLETEPDAAQATPLLEAWTDHLPELAAVTITHHRVGIRPGTNDSKPYAGPHPLDPRICILNGFGSKGASQSPWCAERLCDYITQGIELPKEIAPARRLKFLKSPLQAPQSCA